MVNPSAPEIIRKYYSAYDSTIIAYRSVTSIIHSVLAFAVLIFLFATGSAFFGWTLLALTGTWILMLSGPWLLTHTIWRDIKTLGYGASIIEEWQRVNKLRLLEKRDKSKLEPMVTRAAAGRDISYEEYCLFRDVVRKLEERKALLTPDDGASDTLREYRDELASYNNELRKTIKELES